MKFHFQSYLSRRIILLTICMVLAAIAGQFARFHWILDLATHLSWHYILAGIAFGAILFWLKQPRWALLAIVTALLHIGLVADYVWLKPASAPADTGEEELNILQFNIGSQNQQLDKFYEWIQQQPVLADIVVIIEASPRLKPVVDKMRATGWPHALADYQEDNYGIAVLSRVKDSSLTLEPVGDPYLPSIMIRGKTDNRGIPFAILATHPPPPITASLALARNQQLAAYAQWAKQEPVSNRVIVGDLNATPWSFQYGRLLEHSGMKDGQQGQGYQGTFPAWLPSFLGIPIDHTLVSSNINVRNRDTGPGFSLGSDHRLVTTTLRLRDY